MKYYIISGEASGDLHGSNLIKQLKVHDSNASFRCWGGDLMKEQGVELAKHYKDLAFMGFVEVIQNLRTIYKNIEFCKKDILFNNPDVLILIDYPGFNLRIAEFAKKSGLKVFYYISPQIWAWKQSRVHKIKRTVDKMFVILPFEKEFYSKFDFDVDFTGHPLLDAIATKNQEKPSSELFRKQYKLENKPIVALLPGSRKQEIAVMLPIMLSVQKYFPDHQFVVAGAPSLAESFYEEFKKEGSFSIIVNKSYELLQQAKAALVTSGTATLETALFNVPEVVCYKGNFFSYHIAKRLIKVKFISLVNLIMDREIVKELIQEDLNTQQLKKQLEELLYDENKRNILLKNYEELKEKLGGSGSSEKTAKLMIHYLTK